MLLNTKYIYVSAAVIIVVAIILVIFSVVQEKSGDETLSIYVPGTEETSSTPSPHYGSSGGNETGSITTYMYSPYIEILAYRSDDSDEAVVWVEVTLRAGEGEYFYLVEAKIDNYTRDHPLYEYTVKQFGYGSLITSTSFTVKFEINIPELYLNEWNVGTSHVLYLKLRIPPNVGVIREIETVFIIQELGKAAKQITRVPII